MSGFFVGVASVAGTFAFTTPGTAPGAVARVEPEIAFVMGRDLPPRQNALCLIEQRWTKGGEAHAD